MNSPFPLRIEYFGLKNELLISFPNKVSKINHDHVYGLASTLSYQPSILFIFPMTIVLYFYFLSSLLQFFYIQSFTFCPSSLVFLLFIWVVVYSHSFNLYHILVGLWFSYLISPLLSFSHFLSFIQMYYSVYIYFTLLLHLLYVKVSMWSTTVEFSYLLHWVYHGHKDYHRGY